MAAAIAVQSTEDSLALNHFLQPSHHRQRRFLFGQLCVVDLAGGIVQDHDPVIPAFVLEPLMMAPVDVQQHARQGTPRPALAMGTVLALPRHQSPPLATLTSPRCNSAPSHAAPLTFRENAARSNQNTSPR